MNNKHLYAAAIDKYGTTSQMLLAIEEMSELITALSHHIRGRQDNVEEEIADTLIMLEQLMLIFDSDNVDRWKVEKLKRLEELLR